MRFFTYFVMILYEMSILELNNKGILSEKEFSRLFNDSRRMFIRIANSYVHNLHTAEDITDDSFAKLWEKREEITTENYQAYLFRIIINKCLNHLKACQTQNSAHAEISDIKSRMILHEINSLKSCDPDALFATEIETLFWQCICKMPGITRNVFIASRFRNKTYFEIASDMDLSVRQVTSHIQHALKLLRNALKDYIDR